jgi:hypothetical protein
MNWVRENKFLTGFIAVMVIGAGALGYLLYTAWGTYSDTSDQYNSQAAELNRLQGLTPYPDPANLSKYKAERDDLIDATHTLATSLAQMELPVEPLTPSEFQDRLRTTLIDLTAQAGKVGVKLPDHFAMDFDVYQSQQPLPAAAAPLGRQLAALQIAMNILVNEHIDSLTLLKRTPVAQEGGASAKKPGFGFGNGGGGNNRSKGGPLVEKNSFEIDFVSTQASLQRVLNDFASSDKQFFITRTLVVANSNPKPISKADAEATPPPAAPPAAPAAGQPAISGSDTNTDTSSATYLKFIVGTEKVNVAMRVEMVTFNPPDKSTRTGGPAPR